MASSINKPRKKSLFLVKGRKYGVSAAIAVRNRWAYPADMLGSLFTYSLFVFVFARIWASAYSQKADIAGYDRFMATWYFIFAEMSMFASSGSFWSLAQEVRDGQIAYTLGRPYGFLAYAFAQRIGLSLTQWFLYFAAGFILGSVLMGVWLPSGPLHALCLLVSVILGAALQFLLQTSLAMTSFWLEENSAFFWIYQKVCLVVGTLIPLEFLPEGLRRIVFLTPFPSLVYAPARIAVAWKPGEAIRLIGGQALWILLAALLAGLVFTRGARKTTIQGG